MKGSLRIPRDRKRVPARRMACLALITVLFVVPRVRAMEFSWHETGGGTHDLSEYTGRSVIMHFWASWCVPCRAELPELAVWQRRHPKVSLIPVSLDRNAADAGTFLEKHHIRLPLLTTDMQAAMRIGVRGLPTTLIIGPNGEVRKRYLGLQPWNDPGFSRNLLAALK